MVAMECVEIWKAALLPILFLYFVNLYQRAGRLRKYEGLYFSANKRIYISELTMEKLRVIKSSNGLGSYDVTVLAHHGCREMSICKCLATLFYVIQAALML